MRRSGSIVVGLCMLLSACGSGKSARPAPAFTSLPSKFGPFQPPAVSSDQVGVDPKITSTTLPPDDSMIKVLHQGTGPAVTGDDEIVADFRGQAWEPSGFQIPPFVDTFAAGTLFARPVSDTGVYWTKKIQGVKVGSRVLVVMVPKDTFGIHPPPNSDLNPNDTLMFVVDVLGAFPRNQGPTGATVNPHDSKLPTVAGTTDPKVTVPSGAAPTSFQSQVLVRGKGAKVADDQWVVVQYTGLLWNGGKVFDSTWTRKDGPSPEAIRMAPPGLLNGQPANGQIPGIIKGLVGQPVGSRLLLVIPPDQGYGKNGLATAGISVTDTLVFVVDILGAYRTGRLPTASPEPTS